ncbi:MAG: licC domain protein [Clostridia bacterium]|nr:licC domain protein [Clostridia bacterium]
MKVLLLTVAGTSTRFGKSLGRECLKCIYNEKGFEESLLSNMARKDKSFDKIVIVGGYKFGELKEAVDKYFDYLKEKIVLVENEHYFDYGSGYSLYQGLKYLVDTDFDEIVFAEGDLWVDNKSFIEVSSSDKDVITFNRDTIDAQKSVVLYFDIKNEVHYLYDTAHSYLQIDSPFLSIYNSGQIWKFSDKDRVKKSFYGIDEKTWQGTNLVFIQKYFGDRNKDEYEMKEFKVWLNCNTVEDFRKIAEVKN